MRKRLFKLVVLIIRVVLWRWLRTRTESDSDFSNGPFTANIKVMQPIFRSGGFIHGNDQHSAAIIEDSGDKDKACVNFVTHGQTYNNWVVVDVHVVIHRSK